MNNAALALIALLLTGAAVDPEPRGPSGLPPWTAVDTDDQPSTDPHRVRLVEGLAARSHQYLVQHQNRDGSFSLPRHQAGRSAPVAVTSLAALSFLAAGHLPDPDRSIYGRSVSRSIDWLVDRCNEEGYFYYDGDKVSRMHGQGYAVLALTQAYGAAVHDPLKHERLRDAIGRGVALIESTQGALGGWYYEPRSMEAHEGSITVCMLQALRAAKEAGFTVDTAVIERAEKYMWRSQDVQTGRFRYAINIDQTSWSLTAAALSTLNALGDYGSEPLERGFEALQRDDPFTGRGHFEEFLDYGALYASQAYWHYRSPKVFDAWWDEYTRACAERQREDGSFHEGVYGSVYSTAIVSLSLQVPLGYLPLFQR